MLSSEHCLARAERLRMLMLTHAVCRTACRLASAPKSRCWSYNKKEYGKR